MEGAFSNACEMFVARPEVEGYILTRQKQHLQCDTQKILHCKYNENRFSLSNFFHYLAKHTFSLN